jgi:predicted 3-demethylubiquinone-9 3-methyltransferase (glyoxalase superfamily)
VNFELEGQEFIGLNAGPQFRFNEAISFFVSCETQKEIDELWARLSAGGAESRCGWLQDRYGVSWQIIPSILPKLLRDRNPAKANAAMQAMLQMGKLDIARLQQAFDAA